MRRFKRLLCFFGIHWEGSSGCGSMYNSKDCDICGGVMLIGILIHDHNKGN